LHGWGSENNVNLQNFVSFTWSQDKVVILHILEESGTPEYDVKARKNGD